MPIVKNIRQTVTIGGKVGSVLLTLFTNPLFWIAIIIPFFPLNLLNYFILFIVNLVIVLANVLIFAVQMLLYGAINLIGALVNIPINWFNDLSISIPFPGDDIEISLPNLPTIPSIPFPPFGTIPPYDIGDVEFFPKKTLLMWIFEAFGISLPI